VPRHLRREPTEKAVPESTPRRRTLLIAVPALILVLAAAGFGWSVLRHRQAQSELTLFGNVDLRQVDLAFNSSERIESVTAQEGDHVLAGQLLARLDSGRLAPQVEEATALDEAQAQVVERLRRGSRPEEISQARANVASAEADAANAQQQYARLQNLAERSAGRAASQQDLDNARAALEVARAKLVLNQKALALSMAGPRREDVAQAQAQLRADDARLHLLQKQLKDAELTAPADAVVRSRLMEPGEITTPQRPVFSLAIVNPKWVRTYVSEADLGKLRPGMAASVSADSFPGQRFTGWIGFISPVAEFTPRTVQTTELRTSLVYEVRVFVTDAQDRLRLGMPATVKLSLAPTSTSNAKDAAQPVAPKAPRAVTG
jgi:HlyD family secretion protein